MSNAPTDPEATRRGVRNLAARAAIAVAASVSCAAVLHGADVRGQAAAVLPVAVVWGAAVLWKARRWDVGSWPVVLLVALAVRAPLVGCPPLLSDDLYRYLFEGLALAAGHNPLLEPPAAVAGVNDGLRALVNHPEVSTVYPPLALAWFRLLAVGGTPAAVQAMTALVDATVPLALLVATRRAWPAWVYALHPLPVLESAAGGHVDVPAVALAMAGVAAWRRGHLGAGWAAAVGGALVKLFPLLMLPVLLRRASPLRRAAWVTAAVAATVLLAAPVWTADPAALRGVWTYSSTWSFNGFAYPWVAPVLGGAARPVLVALGVGAVAWAVARHRDPGEAWAVAGAAFVLLSPTLHPWYVLWAMVPALACGRLGWAAAAVPLTLSYTVLLAFDPETGAWSEAPWLWWVTWPPALAALLAYRSDSTVTTPYPHANSIRNGSEAR